MSENEAAERLRGMLEEELRWTLPFRDTLDKALAAERKATVERIRNAADLFQANNPKRWATHSMLELNRILEAEGKR